MSGFRLILAAAVVCGCLETTASAQRRAPVTVEARVEPGKSLGRFMVMVDLSIASGWHTYVSAKAESAFPATTVTLDLPKGTRAVGEWKKPVGLPDATEPEKMVLTGNVTFSREVETSAGGVVGIKVSYQACDDEKCLPPKTVRTSLKLPGSARPPFMAPVRLVVGNVPLNTEAKQMYPSPAMYDVDGDGANELIVGDIFGSLNVYENTAKKGDPVWSKHRPLTSTDGNPIRVSNW